MSPSSTVDPLENVRRLWTGASRPSPAAALGPALACDDAALCDALRLDCDLRAERTGGVDPVDYLRACPELLARPDACELLLVLAFGFAEASERPALRARLAEAFPATASSLDAVEEMADVVGDLSADDRIVGGRYELGETLGEGAFGRVHAATDLQEGGRVAVKVLHALAGSDAARRLRREAALGVRVEHDNLCRVRDAGHDRGAPYVVMELVEGRTLAKAISDEREAAAAAPPDAAATARRSREVAAVGARLARALQAAHDRGVLHRDVKPSNVMLRDDGSPVLLDLGLAYDLEGRGSVGPSLGGFAGTPAYVAPERFATDGAVAAGDVKSDVYGLGATLYEWLAHRMPFSAASPAALVDAIRRRAPEDLRGARPGVDPAVAAVVHRALEKDPGDRYESAARFADDLERAARGEKVAARRPSPWARLVRWARWNRGLAAATFGLFVALAGGLTVSLLLLGRAEAAEKDAVVGRAREKLRVVDEAVRRGDFPAAYDRATAALGDPFADAVELDLRRARACLALQRTAEFDALAERLAAGSSTPEQAAALDLLRGERAAVASDSRDEGRRLLRRALESGLLPPADAAYVEGLLSPSTVEAEAAFARARDLEPFHRGARVGTAVCRLLLGDLDAARAAAQALKQASPTDPFPPLVPVLCAVVRQDAGELSTALDGLEAARGPVVRGVVAELAAAVSGIFASVDQMDGPASQIAVRSTLAAFKRLNDAERSKWKLEDAGLDSAVVLRLGPLVEVVVETLTAATLKKGKDVAALRAIAERHPDGFVNRLAAVAQFAGASFIYQNAKKAGLESPETPEFHREVALVDEQLKLAERRTSLVRGHRAAVRRQRLVLAFVYSHGAPGVRPSGFDADLRRLAFEAAAEGGWTSAEWAEFGDRLKDGTGFPRDVAETLLAGWRRFEPESVDARMAAARHAVAVGDGRRALAFLDEAAALEAAGAASRAAETRKGETRKAAAREREREEVRAKAVAAIKKAAEGR
jgi:hypothetical protein